MSAVLGAPRGPGINQVAFRDQLFASQALLYKCRRRQAAITEDDVGSLLRLALGFAREGLRPVLTQVGPGGEGGKDGREGTVLFVEKVPLPYIRYTFFVLVL